MIKNLIPYIAVLASAFAVGCATDRSVDDAFKHENNAVPDAEQVSQISYSSSFGLQFEYNVSQVAEIRLNVVAGIYAGTVSAVKHQNGNFVYKGEYSLASNPQFAKKALEDADVNKDKFVSDQESLDLLLKVLEAYAVPVSSSSINSSAPE